MPMPNFCVYNNIPMLNFACVVRGPRHSFVKIDERVKFPRRRSEKNIQQWGETYENTVQSAASYCRVHCFLPRTAYHSPSFKLRRQSTARLLLNFLVIMHELNYRTTLACWGKRLGGSVSIRAHETCCQPSLLQCDTRDHTRYVVQNAWK